jgi:hypothetical protein
MRNDTGAVVVGYFTKIALVLVLFSVVCFDAVSVGVARIGVEDTARSAAVEAAEMYVGSHSVAQAYQAAADYAGQHGATVDPKSFSVAPDGTVTLRVDKEATTLLLYRTKKTTKWAHVAATGSGRAV